MTIHTDIPIDAYHASEACSNSKLGTFASKGPSAYHASFIARTHTRSDTPAFSFGRLYEDAVCGRPLPPVRPRELNGKPWHGNRKDCKEWQEQHPDAISPDDADTVAAMLESLHSNATAMGMIADATEQVTLRADWPGLPHGIQARPDWFATDSALLGCYSLDLKTCADLDDFARSVHRYGYVKQAGFVDLCAEANGLGPSHYLLACEKSWPYRAQVFELDTISISTGRVWVRQELSRLAGCYERDEWPLVAEEIKQLAAPVWGVDAEEAA